MQNDKPYDWEELERLKIMEQNKETTKRLNPLERQTDNQKWSKSPLYGYRKPEQEEKDGKFWCRCTIPNLRNLSLGDLTHGQAYCMRCNCHWYH